MRRVLCGWPALVGWRFLCVCAFDGFLLWVRIAYACPTIASLATIAHYKVRHILFHTGGAASTSIHLLARGVTIDRGAKQT